jgi:hypothetical protein
LLFVSFLDKLLEFLDLPSLFLAEIREVLVFVDEVLDFGKHIGSVHGSRHLK